MGEAEEDGCRPVKAVGDGFVHYFYVRPHSSGEKDDDRVVFVANVYRGGRRDCVPVDAMEACLRDTLEASCGGIERIELLQSAGGGSTVAARVHFASRVGARALLKKKKELELVNYEDVCTRFRTVSEALESHLGECESLEEHELNAETALSSFEAEKAAESERRKRMDGEVDEDGFVTVSYKRKAVGDAPRQKKKSGGKKAEPAQDDFYRFQLRDAKREKLLKLRDETRAERERVEKIKATHRSRTFKA